MHSVRMALRGNDDAVTLCCSFEDGEYFVGSCRVSLQLFGKLLHLAEGYVAELEFTETRGGGYYAIDGEVVPERTYGVALSATKALGIHPTAVFRPAINRLRHGAPEASRSRSIFLANQTRRSALAALGDPWYVSRGQRDMIVALQGGSEHARKELLGWFDPLRQWLVSEHQGMGASLSDLEVAATIVIVGRAASYPEAYLHHPDPSVPFIRWMASRIDTSLRRLLHLWPFNFEDASRPLDSRMRGLRELGLEGHRRHDLCRGQSTQSDANNATGEPPPPPPTCPTLREPPDPPLSQLPLKRVLALAKESNQDARAEVCRRFSPLIKKLVSAYPFSREDLEQEAQIALLAALDEYNPTRGTFARLAEWRIKDALARAARAEPLPGDEYVEEYESEDGEESPGPAGDIAKLMHRWYKEDTEEWSGGGMWSGAGKDLAIVPCPRSLARRIARC